jgi:spermidine synthase
LDSVDFYKNCRALLTEEGSMTVNLFGRSASYDQSLAKMAEAFGEDALRLCRGEIALTAKGSEVRVVKI